MKAFLHISDLHVSDTVDGRSEHRCASLMDNLFDDIRTNFSQIKFDGVFITGDIAYAGKESEYVIFKEKILFPLLKFTNLSKNEVYLVPGNHDVCRPLISSADGMAERLYQSEGLTSEITKYFEEILEGKQELSRQKNYNAFAKEIYSENPNLISANPLFQTFRLKSSGKSLAIICLNSAIFAKGGKEDDGKLSIGSPQFLTAFETIKRDYNEIIVIAHHPLEWLSEEDREEFSEFAHKRVDLFLCGHMHKYLPASSEIHGDVVIKLQTGAFDSQKINAGYSICILDSDNSVASGRIYYRCKKEIDGQFGAWEERGRKGEDTFSREVTKFDIWKLAKEAQEIEEEIDMELVVNANRSKVNRLRLHEIFDKPILVKGLKLTAKNLLTPESSITPANKPKELKEAARSESAQLKRVSDWEQLDFDELLVQGNSFIISGGEDQGKSTILNYLMILGLRYLQAKTIDRLHVKINYKDIKEGKNKSIEDLIIQSFERTADLRGVFAKKFTALLTLGNCLVLVDNYDAVEERKNKSLEQFVRKYPKNDFVVTVKEAIINDIVAAEGPFRVGKVFQMLRISSIKRKNIRAFISKIYNDTPEKQEIAYKTIMAAIKASRLPGNHFVYAMLLEIYSTKFSLDHIFSEADIVENFIEILLRKHSISGHKPDDPRFKDMLLFLGFVSTQWMENGSIKTDKNGFLEFALQFNKVSNFTYPAERYVEIGIASGILVERMDGIYFAQKCFSDYASANFIRPGSNLESMVLQYAGMIKWDKVIEYYCAKSLSPRPIVESVRGHLTTAKAKCQQYITDKYPSYDYRGRIKDLTEGDGLGVLLKKGVVSLPDHEAISCDKEKNDEELDGQSGSEGDSSVSGEITSVTSGDYSAFADYEILLSLYGRVIKSSPHIMDPKFQNNSYHDAIKEFREFIGIGMIILERELWPEMKKMMAEFLSAIKVDKMEIKDYLSKAESFLGVVLSFVPRMIQRKMSSDLGAISHQKIIEDILLSGDANIEDQAMLRMLKCDLEMGDYCEEISILSKIDINYVRISVYLKICEILKYDYKLNDEPRAKLKRIAQKLSVIPSVNRTVNLLTLSQERQLKEFEANGDEKQ